VDYDIVIVGGGPGGLMAARTAAQAGLKTMVLERKKNVTEIKRACLEVLYLRWITPDGYLEPVALEHGSEHTKIHLLGPGISVNYKGPLRPYNNVVFVSPGGHRVYAFKDEIYGYYYDKSLYLAGLFEEATAAGAEIRADAICLAVENTSDGANVRFTDSRGEHVLRARRVIAADGVNSKVVESLGLNDTRQTFVANRTGVGNITGPVDADIPEQETSWISLHVPSLNHARLGIGHTAGGLRWVLGDYAQLRKFPCFEPWFARTQTVKRVGFSMTVRTPLRVPVSGNVVIVGDAGAPVETWTQGATASGYLAVRAILKEFDGEPGNAEYTHWWQQAFFFNDPGFFKRTVAHHALLNLCSDEEMDYIYQIFADRRVVPTLAFARQPEIIKQDHPKLYRKFTENFTRLMAEIDPIVASYPTDASIYGDPDAYLGGWRPQYASVK
jgi:digeranylgeranylglycerophospholipid reductase